jgi:hypothetical protein
MSRSDARETVEGVRTLDIGHFQKHKLLFWPVDHKWGLNWKFNGENTGSIGWMLRGEQNSPRAMRLLYRSQHCGEWVEFDYEVELTSTPCNYGGVRWWYLCPVSKKGVPCRRRVRILYTPFGQPIFACRRCNNLTYESCQRSGTYFYESVSRPMDIRDKYLDKFRRARTWKTRKTLMRKLLWADRMLGNWLESRPRL